MGQPRRPAVGCRVLPWLFVRPLPWGWGDPGVRGALPRFLVGGSNPPCVRLSVCCRPSAPHRDRAAPTPTPWGSDALPAPRRAHRGVSNRGGGRAPLSFLARCQRGQPVGAECCRRMGRGPPRCPTAPPGGRGPFPPPCFAWRGGSPLFAVCPQGRAVTPHPRPFCGAPKEAAGGPRPIEPLSGVGAAALLGSTQQRSSPPPHPPSVPRCAVWGPPFVLAPASRCHRILRGPDPIRCPLPSPHSPEPPLSPLPPPVGAELDLTVCFCCASVFLGLGGGDTRWIWRSLCVPPFPSPPPPPTPSVCCFGEGAACCVLWGEVCRCPH